MAKERAKVGFDDNLETLDPNDWKAKKGQGTTTPPKLPKEEIRKVAEQTGFTSREGTPAQNNVSEKRTRRVYRTGRNEQFNMKVRPIDKQTFLEITDQQQWVLGETLERALAALQRELQETGPSTQTK